MTRKERVETVWRIDRRSRAHHLRSQAKEAIMPVAEDIISDLKNAWDRELRRSRPFWVDLPDFPFPYNRDAPSIAYDPASIPSARLGAFLHLKYSPPPEANNLAVTREHIEAGRARGDLRHEFGNELIAHPNRADLILIPNRWPRVSYHSLIVSREVLPQKMLLDLSVAELSWAARGLVVEFHRFSRILDHFHFHIYPGALSPIYEARDSFVTTSRTGNLHFGYLSAYPVPHIAISGDDVERIAHAVTSTCSVLDKTRVPYGQILMQASSGSYVFLIFIREPCYFAGLSFSLIGLIRSAKNINEQEAANFLTAIHRSGPALAQTELELSKALG
jgi:hypothetical protein